MFPVRYTARPEKLFSMTVFSLRYMLRSKKQLRKTAVYEVSADVEDTVEHDCVLSEVHAEVEETVE